HLADEGGVLLGRDAPHRLPPRLQVAFFNARRTVSCAMLSTTSNSTSRSASSRNVQRAYPAGGCEQASAVNRACCSPSSVGVTGGVSRGLRSRSDSGPASTAWRRHDSRLRVLQPYAAATNSSVQPGPWGPWSHWSKACARWSF